MQEVKCPGCGRKLEVPAAFSGIVTCPECQAKIPCFQGRETSRKCPCCSSSILAGASRCWKCGGALDGIDTTPQNQQAKPDVAASIHQQTSPNISGCIAGLIPALFGVYMGDWAIFLVPVGLLVAAVSAFSGASYSCSACGTKLENAKLKICPVCKSRFVDSE